MNVSPNLLLVLLAAYFLGTIPFGLVLGKLFGGPDIRRSGSGNIGATNVARVVGPVPGILTLLLDAAKGWLAVWFTGRLLHGNATFMILAGCLAMVGHCFPIWLRFRGGKGVATAAGIFTVLCPLAMGVAVLLFALIFGFWRYVSLASLAAAAAMPLLIHLLWAPHFAPPETVDLGSLAIAVLVMVQHRGNIVRLARGQEPKFSLGKKDTA